MKTIIINATGAKTGGAKQILLSCLISIDQDKSNINRYIVLSPLSQEDISFSNINIELIKLSTSSIWTYLFSTIFVFLYALRYKSRSIISFNNVNAFFLKKWFDLTTYFHQLKAIEVSESGVRMNLIRMNLSLLKGTTIVVQSSFVKKKFQDYFGVNYDVIVAWPGIRKINQSLDSKYISDLINKIKVEYQYVAVWPVSMVYSEHKGFRTLWSLSKELKKLNVAIIIPGYLKDVDELPNIFTVGSLSSADLDVLYCKCDFMIFTSTFETLGLPIFEYIQLQKKSFVLNAPYLTPLRESYEIATKFIVAWDNEEDFFKKLELNYIASDDRKYEINIPNRYYFGDWGFWDR